MKIKGLCVVAAVAAGTACGSGSPGAAPTSPTPPPVATAFSGTLAGTSSQSGSLDVTVQATVARVNWFLVAVLNAQSPVAASGVIRLASGMTTVAGSYDTDSRSIALSGGGYTVSGGSNAGVLSGRYSGPDGVVGGFSALSGAASQVTRYCGSYLSVTPLQPRNGVVEIYREAGTFNLQVGSSGLVSGVYASITPAAYCCGFMTGRASGSSLSITTDEGASWTATVSGGSVTGSGSSPRGAGTTTATGSTSACP